MGRKKTPHQNNCKPVVYLVLLKKKKKGSWLGNCAVQVTHGHSDQKRRSANIGVPGFHQLYLICHGDTTDLGCLTERGVKIQFVFCISARKMPPCLKGCYCMLRALLMFHGWNKMSRLCAFLIHAHFMRMQSVVEVPGDAPCLSQVSETFLFRRLANTPCPERGTGNTRRG